MLGVVRGKGTKVAVPIGTASAERGKTQISLVKTDFPISLHFSVIQTTNYRLSPRFCAVALLSIISLDSLLAAIAHVAGALMREYRVIDKAVHVYAPCPDVFAAPRLLAVLATLHVRRPCVIDIGALVYTPVASVVCDESTVAAEWERRA